MSERVKARQTHAGVLEKSDQGNDLTAIVGPEYRCRVFIRTGTPHFDDAKPGEKWDIHLIEEFGHRRGIFRGELVAKSEVPLTPKEMLLGVEFDATFADSGAGLVYLHGEVTCKPSRSWVGPPPEPETPVKVRVLAWSGEEPMTAYVVPV